MTPSKCNLRSFHNPIVGLSSSMVVVHRAHGFRFVIYTHDHEPAHVHVVGAGLAKVHLLGPDGRPEVVDVRGIKRADMASACSPR